MTDRVSLASTALPGRWRRVDALAILLVLLFAFGAASFVARNSDLWLHLTTGRLIADGDYRFGTDPFAYTSGDRYWANHAWLFDLAAYSAFTSWGGSVLVALKAAVVAATAGLMLLAGRTRGPMWITRRLRAGRRSRDESALAPTADDRFAALARRNLVLPAHRRQSAFVSCRC